GLTARLWSTSLRRQRGGHRRRAHVREHVRARRTLPGSAASVRSKKSRAWGDVIRGRTLVQPSQTLKIEVHRVGVWRLFRPRLGSSHPARLKGFAGNARRSAPPHFQPRADSAIEPDGPSRNWRTKACGPFSSSKRLMRILGAIVEPTTGLPAIGLPISVIDAG